MRIPSVSQCRSFPQSGLKKSAPQPARVFMSLAVVLFAIAPAFCQTAFTLPPWLVSYPGTNPKVYSSDNFAQTSYVVDAQPGEVVDHYRKVFEAQGLAFQPNPDGMGTTIRIATKECDLFIQIRKRDEGTFTKVTCSGKVDPSSMQASENPNIEMVTGITPPPPKAHAKGDGKQEDLPPGSTQSSKGPHNIPATALLWPSWLTNLSGFELSPVLTSDSRGSSFLKAEYDATGSMTEIFDFYRKLLQDHDYRSSGTPAAGRAAAGSRQNPTGALHGIHYEKGASGLNTTIDISTSRQGPKGPTTVTMRFSMHDSVQEVQKPASTPAGKTPAGKPAGTVR